MDSEKEQFEYAISQNRYDRELRLIYADWLEERGDDPERAKFQREWTTAWQRADDWLRDFAVRGNTTFEKVKEAAQRYLKEGKQAQLGKDGMGFDVTNLFGWGDDPITPQKFWENWHIWSKTQPPEEPFSCCDWFDCCDE